MEVSGQLHTPARFIPLKKKTCTHRIGSWVGPRATLDVLQKDNSLVHAGIRTPDSAARYLVAIPTTGLHPDDEVQGPLLRTDFGTSRYFGRASRVLRKSKVRTLRLWISLPFFTHDMQTGGCHDYVCLEI
jgi:hypothetical protein